MALYTDGLKGSSPMAGKKQVFQRLGKQLLVWVAICLWIEGLVGCSTQQLASGWKSADIVTNGIDSEWPADPQFVDDDPEMAVVVVNDHQSLALCIKTDDAALKRQFLMDGLTVWIDVSGGKDKIFGIHVPGGSPMQPGRRPSLPDGAAPPADKTPRIDTKHRQMLPIEPIKKVAVTYLDATGPLTMDMDEVRRTGVDIGMGQADKGALVYELSIAFKAAPSLADLTPGTMVGIGIMTGGANAEDRKPQGTDDTMGQGGPPGGGSGPGPGGSMGRPGGGMMGGPQMDGGPGGPPQGAKKDQISVWLKVQLADGAKG